MADVAERLRACKDRSGLSLAELREKTDISRSHISSSHSGTQPISTEYLERLAGPYHTTVSWLRDGDPTVHVWAEFQATDACRRLGSASSGPGDRAACLIRYLSDTYPGHLLVEDLHKHMHVSLGLLEDILNGRRPPSDEFLKALAQLSGVPYRWLQIGDAELLNGAGRLDGFTAEQLRRWLDVARRAEELGVSPEDVGSFLALVGKSKGGT